MKPAPLRVAFAAVGLSAVTLLASSVSAQPQPRAPEPEPAPQKAAGTASDPHTPPASAAPAASVPASPAPAETTEVEALKRELAAQDAKLQTLQAEVTELKSRTAPQTATAGASGGEPAPEAQRDNRESLSDQGTTLPSDTTVQGEGIGAPRPGNAPLDPSYAGFVPILNGSIWFSLGGYVKVDAIVDSTKLGNPNQFATSGIPVVGEATFDSAEQFNLHARQSRVNMELRSPTPIGSLRVFYENDFADGSSTAMAYRLRQLYVQVANVTIGQTWTTFLDPDAIPSTLDFSGPGVQALRRQPQFRYTFSPSKKAFHLALSAEQPTSDVVALPATGSTRNVAPDIATNARWEGGLGHVQGSGLVRVLAYDDSAGAGSTAVGWGVAASGVLRPWGKDTVVGSVTIGRGIGRYMQDLGTENGAVVDASGSILTIPVWGTYVGFRHFWIDNLSSQITYGYVDVDNIASQAGTAYDETHYAQGNLIWSPAERFFLGAEYLYGHKRVFDGSAGDAHRAQLSFQYMLR